MTNLDYYLTKDFASRRNTSLLGCLVGMVMAPVLHSLGESLSVIVVVCVVAAGVIEITRAITYKQPSREAQRKAVAIPVRWGLVYASVAAILVLLISPVGTARVEAAINERIARAADNASSEQNALIVADLVNGARQNSVKLTSAVVTETGKKFIGAGEHNPEAWKAVTALLNYKSSSAALPPNIRIEGTKKATNYLNRVPLSPGFPVISPPVMTTVGIVPIDQAAKFNLIGQDQNAGSAYGDQYVFADGGGLIIDNFEIRNVIFRNVHIVYDGGPIKIDNAHFVNCTFDMDRNPTTAKLASLILEAHSTSPVSFLNPS